MLRVIVLVCMVQACQSARAANAPSSHAKHLVSDGEKDADLKALDLADQDLSSRLPKNTDIKLEKPKVAKATIAKKALRRNAHPRNEPLPDEKTKSSVLWAHDREMKFSEEAAQVLEVGDKAAQAKIRAMKESETARVAPAKVVHVSEKEADAAAKSEDDALEGSRNMEQDLKDLKEREVEQEDDEKQKNDAAKTEKALVKNATKANVEPKSEKKADLDHLMKLSAQMKNDAKNFSQKKLAFAQEAPATADHRFKAMKNLADSVAKAKAGIADEPEQEIVAIPSEVANKGEMAPDKVQRLKALAGKMNDAAKGQPGTGPKVVEESEAEASTDEGELVEGEQVVAIPQQALPASQTPQFSTKYTPQTVAAKSFKGSSMKDAVKQSAKDFHNKISDHVVNMHAALRDHALEMENKAKEAKIRAQMEAAAKAREAAEAEKRKEQEAQQAAIDAQKEAEDERLRQIAAKAQQENSIAARAQKAMAKDQVADQLRGLLHDQVSNSNSQHESVSESELKRRDEAHQKMLAYREQQKKERQEQKRERDLIAKDALEAQKAAETLRALEHELPAEDTPKKKKSAAAGPASVGFVILAVVLASY